MEIWDIYDANRQRTGKTMARDDWRMKPGEYHISVIGAIQKPDGRYLITQRKEDKPWGAGWWEFPGGAVRAGEEPDQAVARELGEETGLDVSSVSRERVYSYERVNPDEQNNYFMDVYRLRFDFEEADVKVQEEEVAGFMLATADEIRAFADQGIFLHYDSICSIFE
jgi:8-oxo-dGTP diphosphatase